MSDPLPPEGEALGAGGGLDDFVPQGLTLRSHFKTPSPGICLRKPQGKQVYICSDGGF